MTVPGTGIGTNSYMDMTKDSSIFKEMFTMSRFYPFSNGIECIPNFNHLEPIILSNAILTPPLPGEIPMHHRKPLGCRTVYVGCMPEKITEEIVREIFARCGTIFSVRMSGSHFCHIRFADNETVDQALLLSGFRIQIEENDEPAYNSKMHVDYALSRDDQYDYEQLELIQEKNHRKLQGFQPPSSPPLHYSELEAKNLEENFHDEQTFKKSCGHFDYRIGKRRMQ
ncbi:ecto-NOX disulfide-thiol exchanger 1 [Caerostris extrusa]|uniref:Ecto-NOX disulfide-thiol exchanger 1 n=1 Tax=Caerostris extrusa TaxID=172846 RepID=A0AAV4MX58_CAEEX|nr:ecto-NOX disulfide-thiol exchanger 1 [Caerostris extrusa]